MTSIALALVACGTAADDVANATPAPAEAVTTPAPGGDEDPTNPWNLAWIVSGAPGLEFETTEALTANGGVQNQTGRRTVDETGAFSWPYSQFVEEVSVEVTVISGGPGTASLVVARFVDPQAAVGALEVREVLESVEVQDGESVTLSGTR